MEMERRPNLFRPSAWDFSNATGSGLNLFPELFEKKPCIFANAKGFVLKSIL